MITEYCSECKRQRHQKYFMPYDQDADKQICWECRDKLKEEANGRTN